VVAAVSGVLCVLALAGCGTLKAGAAAIVGDEQLSQADVTDVTEELDAELAEGDIESTVPENEVPLYIVATWVDATLVEALAAKEGVSVTPGELDDALAGFDEDVRRQLIAERALPPSQFERAVQAFLLQQKLAAQLAPGATPEEQSTALRAAMAETADDLGVSVNPRFGTWNPSIPGVEPRAEDRLSSIDAPVEEPSAPLLPTVP
jgi:hypothetical protein